MSEHLSVIVLVLAAAGRVLLPNLRARRDPLSRMLVLEFGVRPSGPGGIWTRRDRTFSSLMSLLSAAACIAAAYLVALVATPFKDETIDDYLATGAAIVLWFLGLMALVNGIAELARAPFEEPGPKLASLLRGARHVAAWVQHPAVFLIILLLGAALAVVIAALLVGAA